MRIRREALGKPHCNACLVISHCCVVYHGRQCASTVRTAAVITGVLILGRALSQMIRIKQGGSGDYDRPERIMLRVEAKQIEQGSKCGKQTNRPSSKTHNNDTSNVPAKQSKQVSRRASKQPTNASKHASEQANEQADKKTSNASKQASKNASKQSSEQSSE